LSVPSRLVYRDCQELLKRVKRRVNDWKNKSLSFAGRAQLIRSVLSSMHIYWASMFILPSSLMYDLEQVIRGFLWCQGDMKKWKAKVAWEVVCLPKKEGGLGIRRLDIFNKALIASHIWSILFGKDSLWVKWIHAYKLKGRYFWEVPLRVISSRDIHKAGFSMGSKVADIISHGSWTWPKEWQKLTSWFLLHGAALELGIIRLIFSASCYFMWQERNFRIFKKVKRSHDQISEIIKTNVRLNLLTCSFKRLANDLELVDKWKLPLSCFRQVIS
nr:reverse transcriptase domain, reverse transcriptase zinc-binding domain protein [Tanacetum cinerariifolium]